MRPLSGKRYCIHVFGADGKPVFYRLSDELVMDGVALPIQSDLAGVLIWSAPMPPHDWSPDYVMAMAHERRVDSVHVDPAWHCRPVRGRHRSGENADAIDCGPAIRYRNVVLSCMCGEESYPRMKVDDYNAVARHEIRLLIPPCPRCGAPRALEPFLLVTSTGEMPVHHMPEMAPRRTVA